MEPQFTVRYGAMSHRGNVRAHNEDSYLTVPPIFLVADGMGGHSRGDAASQAVVNVFAQLSEVDWLEPEALEVCIREAVEEVQGLAQGAHAPGSTLTGAGLSRQSGMPCWSVFNIGDSRTYLVRDGRLEQVTVDHSATQQHPQQERLRNVITRAVGAGMRSPMADEWLIPAAIGDRVMMCSDGLTNELTDELILATLLATPDPQEAADHLVEAAVAAGGRDNVTAVVVDCIDLVSTAPVVDADDTTAGLEDDRLDDDTIPDGMEAVR